MTVGQPFFVAGLLGQKGKKHGLRPRKKKRRDGKNEETGCRSQNTGEVLTLDSEII